MTAGFSVVLATAEDEAHVLRLLAGQFQELEIPIPHERVARAVLGVFAAAERGALLLARLDGRPVGVAYLSYQWTLEHGGKIAWLEELFVEPALRARGLGRVLLQAACDHARSAGCAAVDLEVEESHARAANLYLREGFGALARRRFVRSL
jgi:GNAT superfamily N-acetyltransferase